MSGKGNKQRAEFSLSEFKRLREVEGKSIKEITDFFGMSKATLYRHLNNATKNDALIALEKVEYWLAEYANAMLELLSSANLPAEELKAFRSESQQLHVTLVSNVTDASKLAKKIEAYLKFSE